ncbi:MarR family winged helix-turn-helix transcriptional regulator [Streptomyces sp. NBC_00582]|uniref:MarR family winged helix-turn-helix transcriptional regulator n=1 Tax=Streptomyces sp. NBC_00582 TaxID=2975783 RepID=UPI002E80BBDB|nr:MarR family transcriptional regulator [Streptomyces sp. NBC_00582]WUB66699.1 MarR family winged helix-turn-helix transcriptional regulator [Streptomyces sp. NBC_00582]
MKIGEEAIPTEGVGLRSTGTHSMLIVLLDVYTHSDTTVGEIAARTGLPQSAVSGCVARLKEAGSVVTAPDPADRRRTLLRRNPGVSGRRAEVAATPVDSALAAALGTDDPERIADTIALLEQLAERLSPDVLGRLR